MPSVSVFCFFLLFFFFQISIQLRYERPYAKTTGLVERLDSLISKTNKIVDGSNPIFFFFPRIRLLLFFVCFFFFVLFCFVLFRFYMKHAMHPIYFIQRHDQSDTISLL